jgi:hypothetical protein
MTAGFGMLGEADKLELSSGFFVTGTSSLAEWSQ